MDHHEGLRGDDRVKRRGLSIEEELRRDAAQFHGHGASRLYDDRACPAGETFERIEPHLGPHGITRLARLTGLDRIGIPVWNAILPNALSITVNQGKGIDDLHAKVSAAMEGLERAVAGQPNGAAFSTVTASLRELRDRGQEATTLAPLIAAGQGDLGEDEAVAWAAGFDLIAKREVFVPLAAALLDRTDPAPRFWQSSDGLASGNVLLEAVFHGLLERVERDADVLRTFERGATRLTRCVNPASLGDPVLDALSERIACADLRLRLFDMTSDTAIPCFTAFIASERTLRDRAPRFIDVAMGSGAHPSAVRAAIRAVTEAAQSRMTYISGARDDIPPDDFTRPLPASIQADLAAVPRAYSGVLPAPLRQSLPDLLAGVLDRLTAARISSVIVLPLTVPGHPFAVAKLFVTELEHPDGPRKRRFGRRVAARILEDT